MSISCEIALRWVPQDHTDDYVMLVQVSLGAFTQQGITWANVEPDLCLQMKPLGHDELISPLGKIFIL